MPGSQTTQGRSNTRGDVFGRVAFRDTYRVGTLGYFTFAAQWLAYTLPCRRFAGTLTGAAARLGVNVDRYSFTVTDFHRLLLAGLPAHKRLKMRDIFAGHGKFTVTSTAKNFRLGAIDGDRC